MSQNKADDDRTAMQIVYIYSTGGDVVSVHTKETECHRARRHVQHYLLVVGQPGPACRLYQLENTEDAYIVLTNNKLKPVLDMMHTRMSCQVCR